MQSEALSPLNPQDHTPLNDYRNQPRAPQSSNQGYNSSYAWAAGAGTNPGPFVKKDSTVERKASNELRAFGGDIANYDSWRIRIREHFVDMDMYYKEMYDLV